jgi:hypothetical protein
MIARSIICFKCGLVGKIEVLGINDPVPLSQMFKYLGHNPGSGYMRFQCPSCDTIHLVDPTVLLGNDMIVPLQYGTDGMHDRGIPGTILGKLLQLLGPS